jgi:hypothetical protein
MDLEEDARETYVWKPASQKKIITSIQIDNSITEKSKNVGKQKKIQA